MVERTGALSSSDTHPLMKQSEKGKKVSRGTLAMADTIEDESKKATILNYGIDEIVKSGETTPDEKAFVALSTAMNQTYVGLPQLVSARLLTLKALSETISSPVGAAVAKVVLDISGPVQEGNFKKNILWYGLDTLKKQENLPEKEKALVNFVLEVNEQYVKEEPMMKARECTLDAIASQAPGLAKVVIADVVLDANKSVQDTNSGNNLLWYGLKAIQSDSGLTENEKALVDLGMNMTTQYAGQECLLKARENILNEIVSPSTGSLESAIAHLSLESVKGGTDANNKNNVLWYGLKAICDNPKSANDSKVLAKTVMDMNSKYTGDDNLIRARELVMKELASPSGQSLNDTLRALTLEWADGISDSNQMNNLLWYGAGALKEQLGDEPLKKSLLDFCINLNSSYVKTEAIAHTRKSVLQNLEKAGSDSAGRIYAEISLDAVQGTADENSAANILWYAFDAIEKAPQVTEKEKSLAQKGKNASSSNDPQTRLNAYRSIMEEIRALVSPQEELQQMADKLTNPGAENAIVVEDEVVNINGVKLECKKQRNH